MKNITEILKAAGVEITAEQLTAVEKDVKENYKTVADYEKQKEKLSTAEEKVATLEESLDKFKDVDPEALNGTIEDLKRQLSEKDAEYNQKISDRDFDDLVKEAIGEAHGRNTKAIKALLDVDALKKSNNQKADITKAIKELTEAEDSKMLFGEKEPEVTGKGGVIGSVGSGQQGDAFEAALRSAAGLSAKETK